MKNLIISLITVLFLLAIGCNENAISDPIIDQSSKKVQKGTVDTYVHGIIPLESVLDDPYPVGNSFYRISGEIAYELRILYVDPPPPAPQQYISVYLQIDADLVNICTVCQPSVEDKLSGFISEVSEELIPMDDNQLSITENIVENSFLVQGREDRMTLNIRFVINHKRVQINAMWLALTNSTMDATDN